MIMIIFAGGIVYSGTLLLMGNILGDCSGRQNEYMVIPDVIFCLDFVNACFVFAG